eukprot:gene4367-6654_t
MAHLNKARQIQAVYSGSLRNNWYNILGIFNNAGRGRIISVYDFLVRLSMSSGDPYNDNEDPSIPEDYRTDQSDLFDGTLARRNNSNVTGASDSEIYSVFVGTSGDTANNKVIYMDHREDMISLLPNIGIALRIRTLSDDDKPVNYAAWIRYAIQDNHTSMKLGLTSTIRANSDNLYHRDLRVLRSQGKVWQTSWEFNAAD